MIDGNSKGSSCVIHKKENHGDHIFTIYSRLKTYV